MNWCCEWNSYLIIVLFVYSFILLELKNLFFCLENIWQLFSCIKFYCVWVKTFSFYFDKKEKCGIFDHTGTLRLLIKSALNQEVELLTSWPELAIESQDYGERETYRKEKGGTWIFHGLFQSGKGGERVNWFFLCCFLDLSVFSPIFDSRVLIDNRTT